MNKFHDMDIEMYVLNMDAISHQYTLCIWSGFDTIKDSGVMEAANHRANEKKRMSI